MFGFTVIRTGDYDNDADDKIEQVIGKENLVSAGYGFGERDMQFEFSTRELADAAHLKAKSIDGIEVLDVEEVFDWQ